MSKAIYSITRKVEGKADYTVTMTDNDMDLIYEALNDYPQWNDDEDDNPTSVIMNKLYNMLEF
jgi:hypothetical protein